MGLLHKASSKVKEKLPLFWDFKQKLNELKLKKFKAKYPFVLEYKDFYIKTAESALELKQVLQLRHRIFFETRLGANSKSYLNEFDAFDLSGDHLLLKRKSDGRVIGCYRVLPSQFNKRFYSETEFDLSDLLSRNGNKLELGRACIDPEFRNGITIYLVWKGLAKYIEMSECRYLFGCSSADFSSPTLLEILKEQLQDHKSDAIAIAPLPEFLNNFPEGQQLTSVPEHIQDLVPPLLRSYISAGAKVYGEPIFDPIFKTYDFFTILDMNDLTDRFRKKFFS